MSINGVQAVFASTDALTGFAPERSTSANAEAIPPKPSSNDILKNLPQARQLQVDAFFGQANRIIYRILDKQTGDLILQVPPEQLLEIASGIQESLLAEQASPKLDVRS
jgi:FlaG protein